MANPMGSNPIFDQVFTKKNIVSGLGATQTLSIDQTNSVVNLDRAAGIIVTLPVAIPGLIFEFKTPVSVTTNNYKVITNQATEFLVGSIRTVKTDLTTLENIPDGTTHRAVTMNGTTTGGLKGTNLRFICLSSTIWEVTGAIQASGVIVTPLAAA